MTGRKLLVVNADDAGLHPDVDDAILSAAGCGVVLSASVVVTGPTAASFVARAREAGLGLGLHLNLSEGRPAGGPYRTLTDGTGCFLHPKEAVWSGLAESRLDADELRDEVAAQWARLHELGARPGHVDGHNHIHAFEATLAALVDAVSDPDGLFFRVPDEPECPDPLRPRLPAASLGAERIRRSLPPGGWRTADRFAGFFFCEDPDIRSVAHLEHAVEGVTEWMVHPGRRPGTEFTEDPRRRRELEALCRPELAARLAGWGYTLARFGDAR